MASYRSLGSVTISPLSTSDLTIYLGVPHYSMEDDVYEGMFIPKKSIVIANARFFNFATCASQPPE